MAFMLTSSLRYNITLRVRRAVTKINPAQFKSRVIRRVSPPLASGCQTVGDGAELFRNGLQIFSLLDSGAAGMAYHQARRQNG